MISDVTSRNPQEVSCLNNNADFHVKKKGETRVQ